MRSPRTTEAVALAAVATLVAAAAVYRHTTHQRVALVVGTGALLIALAAAYAACSTARFALLAGGVGLVTGLTAGVAYPDAYPVAWFGVGVGAVYALVIPLAVRLHHRRDRPPGVTATAAVATVAVVALAPLTYLLVAAEPNSPVAGWEWLPVHLLRTVPVAFALPLGVARTDRGQAGPALAMLAAWAAAVAAYLAEIGVLLAPGVASLSAVFGVYAAAGGPLFLVGRNLSRGDDPLPDATCRTGTPETG